jgi:hypothetical protein
MTARADAQALRLSVAYALLDGFPVIRLPHLRAALAVVEYARASVEWLYGTKTGDPDVDSLEAELRRKKKMTSTEVRDFFGRHPGPRGAGGAGPRAARASPQRHYPDRGRPTTLWRPGKRPAGAT